MGPRLPSCADQHETSDFHKFRWRGCLTRYEIFRSSTCDRPDPMQCYPGQKISSPSARTPSSFPPCCPRTASHCSSHRARPRSRASPPRLWTTTCNSHTGCAGVPGPAQRPREGRHVRHAAGVQHAAGQRGGVRVCERDGFCAAYGGGTVVPTTQVPGCALVICVGGGKSTLAMGSFRFVSVSNSSSDMSLSDSPLLLLRPILLVDGFS